MRKVIVTACLVTLLAVQPALAQTNSADVTKPTISGVTVSGITSTAAVVSWSTSEAATSYVDFGLSDVYDNTRGEGSYVTAHSVSLLGLTPGTLYHFRIRSKDAAGNEAVSTDTTLTTATAATNTNTATNTNAGVNKNSNTNTANLNTNKSSNTNTAKNANSATNANRNTNTAKNANVNSNKNANLNTNSGLDIFNQNTNQVANANTENDSLGTTNADVTNVNATPAGDSSDGRAGLVLIAIGILLLVGIIGFAWWKARRPPVVRP